MLNKHQREYLYVMPAVLPVPVPQANVSQMKLFFLSFLSKITCLSVYSFHKAFSYIRNIYLYLLAGYAFYYSCPVCIYVLDDVQIMQYIIINSTLHILEIFKYM